MIKWSTKYIKKDEVLSLNLPLRYLDVRDDGYIFKQYNYRIDIETGNKKLSEMWLSPKSMQKHQKRKSKDKRKLFTANRLFINRVKRRYGCQTCGYKKSLSALEFHHLHSKKNAVSRMMLYARVTLKEEIKKCILVCSNCHSEIHDQEKTQELVE